VGVGARHALFPVHRTLGAPPVKVGGRLPDASPRGNAEVSVSWQDRRRNCFRRLLGEAFQHGSGCSCRSNAAAQGDETAATRPRHPLSPGRPAGTSPGALAWRYESCLLALNERLLVQAADALFAPTATKGLAVPASGTVAPPAWPGSFRSPSCEKAFSRGALVPPCPADWYAW
jgi:hypothetical protein